MENELAKLERMAGDIVDQITINYGHFLFGPWEDADDEPNPRQYPTNVTASMDEFVALVRTLTNEDYDLTIMNSLYARYASGANDQRTIDLVKQAE